MLSRVVGNSLSAYGWDDRLLMYANRPFEMYSLIRDDKGEKFSINVLAFTDNHFRAQWRMKIILQSMEFHVEFLCIVIHHIFGIFFGIKIYLRRKDFFLVNREQDFSDPEFSFTERTAYFKCDLTSTLPSAFLLKNNSKLLEKFTQFTQLWSTTFAALSV